MLAYQTRNPLHSYSVTLQIDATYNKSQLRDAFLGAVISGFSSGSLVVSFEATFDQRYLYFVNRRHVLLSTYLASLMYLNYI